MPSHYTMETSWPPKPAVKSKPQIQDESIMGTNNSSIVSKRSVERLYFSKEPHYFRFFVKKPQRRAPLINRGYWLRMKAVDHTVRQFLETSTTKQKIVVNLGCGYDPLPWQCLSRYPASCSGVKFVDVDFRELMLKKRDAVQNTPELVSMLTSVEQSLGDILLRSDQYFQVGCDLRNLTQLHEALESVIDMNSQVLFVAEVSITYMNLEHADALIKWTSGFVDARFCLLEQLLPDGSDHPFAQTMLAHFHKLRTPLGSVHSYPTKSAQKRRFKRFGWDNVSIRNLWELWSSPDFLTSKERCSLDKVEPFDEWEEFALFGCHYFLLIAGSTGNESDNMSSPDRRSNIPPVITTAPATTEYSENPKSQGLRRFAAALPVRVPWLSADGVGNFGGMGLNTRVASCDLYVPVPDEAVNLPVSISRSNNCPSSRMCHTITDLREVGALLVGGRTSPDNVLTDCWLWHKWMNVWERIDDLPQPRYRHTAIDLGHDGCVLVSPGRCNSRDIGSDFLIWSRQLGWTVCMKSGAEIPPATYGGVFTLFNIPTSSTARGGILAGGISEHGILEQDIWEWNLHAYMSQEPTISFKRLLPSFFGDLQAATIARFGAATINHGSYTYILGGIIKDEILRLSDEIISFATDTPQHELSVTTPIVSLTPRPLLVGFSVVSRGNSLLVVGGSAVCFSFGTFWNRGCFTLNTEIEANGRQAQIEHQKPLSQWQYWSTSNSINVERIQTTSTNGSLATVPRVKIQSAQDLDKLLQMGKPVIIEGLDLGPCTEKWTTDYLKGKIGAHREIIIHEAKAEHMDFQVKNFSYVTTTFDDFIERADSGAQLYLRSLSSENSAQIPADIKKDFPSIAGDFRLPLEWTAILENIHSAPLRISGPVIMWLHYDVMANILCQIRGEKRLLLFPPSDIIHFEFEPGSSSSSINAFDKLQDNTLTHTQTHDAILLPGDVLFLPPLWLHTALPTSPGISVAVNVFFRNLPKEKYATGKDVYGNRDLQAYEKGRQDIAKVIKSFESLPRDVADFYLGRLSREFDACRP